MKRRDFPGMLTMLITVFITVGCSPSLADLYTVTSSPTYTLSTTPSRTLTPILPASTQVSPTATPTPFPLDTPIPTDTMPPLPTLLPEAAQNLTLELMMTNGGCELPCWWGLTPGETLRSDAFHFLQTFISFIPYEAKSGNQLGYSFRYQLPGRDENNSNLSFWTSEGIISQIHVGKTGMELKYQLDRLLDTLGKPEEIYFQHFWLGEVGKLELHLFLFFHTKGVLAYYLVPTEVTEAIYRSCFEGVGPELTLWTPNNEVETAVDILGERNLEELLSIEEAGMTHESFYETFIDLENHPCLEVSAP